MTLYTDLGVAPNADEATIKAAYRQKAKSAHPDKGGSRQTFDALSRAKSVLLDPERRAQYDRDGTIDEAQPDNDLSQAVGVVVQTLYAVIGELEKLGRAIEQNDIIGVTARDIQAQITDAENLGDKMRADIRKIRKLSKRFHARKGKTNRLALVFKHRAAEIERSLIGQDERVRILKMAHAIAKDHTFDVDAPQYAQTGGGFFQGVGC